MNYKEKQMYKILNKETLAPDEKMYVLDAPDIAGKTLPGQFIIIRIDENGERIPLTIADYDRKKGTITIIVQEVGKSTIQLGTMKKGDSIFDVAGPLGVPTHIEKYGTVICVGGGVGIACIYPIASAMKQAGNKVICILGARTRELIFWEDKIKAVSDEVYITTDDGSYGRKGFVSGRLKELIDEKEKIDRVMVIGPVIMMKVVSEVTRPYKIKTIVSLNSIMVDGTGMCGSCRVEIGDEIKFACVDGPDFDAHQVNYDLLMNRQKVYAREEKEACNKCEQEGNVNAGK